MERIHSKIKNLYCLKEFEKMMKKKGIKNNEIPKSFKRILMSERCQHLQTHRLSWTGGTDGHTDSVTKPLGFKSSICYMELKNYRLLITYFLMRMDRYFSWILLQFRCSSSMGQEYTLHTDFDHCNISHFSMMSQQHKGILKKG